MAESIFKSPVFVSKGGKKEYILVNNDEGGYLAMVAGGSGATIAIIYLF